MTQAVSQSLGSMTVEIRKRRQDTGSLPSSGSHLLSEPYLLIGKGMRLNQLVSSGSPACILGVRHFLRMVVIILTRPLL